jgi:hypothetical protein
MVKIIFSIIIFSASALFYSCKKETITPVVVTPLPPLPPIPNTPLGKELVFDDLTWNLYNSGFPEWDEIYLVIPSVPDLNRSTAEIFLKYDTSANWVQVVRPGAMPNQHVYFFTPKDLFVEVYPLNYQLPGRKASVKVKF